MTISLTKDTLDFLLSPAAIRERSKLIYDLTLKDQGFFKIKSDQFENMVEIVAQTIEEKYPDFKIPYHSRWNHFNCRQVNRVSQFEKIILHLDPIEQARVKIDLVVTSVLLDAGAGDRWQYQEAERIYQRSEGLAIASYNLFMKSTFGGSINHPLADGHRLSQISIDEIGKGFQVNQETNPLLGLAGRTQLLNSLGKACLNLPHKRPGGLVDLVLDLLKGKNELPAEKLLKTILASLGPIWPGRINFENKNLGDTWAYQSPHHHEKFLIPFHKLSQWLSYSLFEVFEKSGIKIIDNNLTGLPEYRNGGLLIDSGYLELKDKSLEKIAHKPSSPLILEWRALTIVALDLIAEALQKKLKKTRDQFPLVNVLEGGTWWAGRKLATMKRASGGPPLQIESDGTVF
jgi:hypothetical protein